MNNKNVIHDLIRHYENKDILNTTPFSLNRLIYFDLDPKEL